MKQIRKASLESVQIDSAIYLVRGERVIWDSDLAKIYGIPTFRLNEAVKRNRNRFPEDFLFRPTKNGPDALTSQIAISNKGRGEHRTVPYTFTEHGAVMAANIMKNECAVQMSIFVVPAFNSDKSSRQEGPSWKSFTNWRNS
ncbi:MAG: ORF6N domain-containing protein [Bacteroidetes bacterium]|nr:ORF6N domain-containing protein [Bacteroidota bacterium]